MLLLTTIAAFFALSTIFTVCSLICAPAAFEDDKGFHLSFNPFEGRSKRSIPAAAVVMTNASRIDSRSIKALDVRRKMAVWVP